jgi:RNA polymerase sigma-70 factor (ECF subfamily)
MTSAPRHVADLQLAERAADGARDAQRELARRMAPRTLRLARALMRGSHEAEDGAQLAMIEILKSVHGYRGDSSLERWCDRICARTVIRHARKTRARKDKVVELHPELHARPSASLAKSPEHARSMANQEVLQLFNGLSPERVEVMVLKHGLGYSVREIAELMACPEGTVKDRLVRARKDLRKKIESQGSEGLASSPGGR